MPERALILIANGTEEIEGIAPGDVLIRSGIEVTYAGVNGTALTGQAGIPLGASLTTAQAAQQVETDGLFDAIVIPGGGKGAENIAADHASTTLINAHWQSGKIVASICASPGIVLAPLGILDGKRATCYPSVEAKFGPSTTFDESRVVTDGNLITSRGPATAIDFGLAIAAAVKNPAAADQTAAGMLVV